MVPVKENIPVAAAIIINEGYVMIAFRKKELSHGGFWEFPGGKIQMNESPEEALIREISEEFGSTFVPMKYIGYISQKLPHMTIDLHGVIGNLTSPVQFLKDHEEIKWFKIRELFDVDLGEADLKLLRTFEKEISKFVAKQE